MEYFKLGQITSPVGIKGEMRVYPYTDDTTRFSAVKTILVEGEKEPRKLEKYRPDKNLVVIKLSGIDDRNASELYRGKNLLVNKEDFPLDEDVFFADDIVGIEVYTEDGQRVGKVSNILNKPNQDIYEIEKEDGKSFMLPAVKEFVLDVNVSEGKMTVHLIDGIMDL